MSQLNAHYKDLFIGGTLERTPFNYEGGYQYDDPTFLTFKLEFGKWGASLDLPDYNQPAKQKDIFNSDFDDYPLGLFNYNQSDIILNSIGGANSIDANGWNYGTEYSAVNWLLNRNQDRRALYLKQFIEGINDLQKRSQWSFQKITGINELLKVDPKTSARLSNPVTLKITCLENVDLRIKTLMNLYRHAAWDDVYQRWALPDILRQFKLIIYISEIRQFHSEYSNPDTDIIKDMDISPVLTLDCSPCEFVINPTWDSAEYSAYGTDTPESTTIEIKVSNLKVFEKAATLERWGKLVIEDYLNDSQANDIYMGSYGLSYEAMIADLYTNRTFFNNVAGKSLNNERELNNSERIASMQASLDGGKPEDEKDLLDAVTDVSSEGMQKAALYNTRLEDTDKDFENEKTNHRNNLKNTLSVLEENLYIDPKKLLAVIRGQGMLTSSYFVQSLGLKGQLATVAASAIDDFLKTGNKSAFKKEILANGELAELATIFDTVYQPQSNFSEIEDSIPETSFVNSNIETTVYNADLNWDGLEETKASTAFKDTIIEKASSKKSSFSNINLEDTYISPEFSEVTITDDYKAPELTDIDIEKYNLDLDLNKIEISEVPNNATFNDVEIEKPKKKLIFKKVELEKSESKQQLHDISLENTYTKPELKNVSIIETKQDIELAPIKLEDSKANKVFNDVSIDATKLNTSFATIKIEEAEANKSFNKIKLEEPDVNKKLQDIEIDETNYSKDLVPTAIEDSNSSIKMRGIEIEESNFKPSFNETKIEESSYNSNFRKIAIEDSSSNHTLLDVKIESAKTDLELKPLSLEESNHEVDLLRTEIEDVSFKSDLQDVSISSTSENRNFNRIEIESPEDEKKKNQIQSEIEGPTKNKQSINKINLEEPAKNSSLHNFNLEDEALKKSKDIQLIINDAFKPILSLHDASIDETSKMTPNELVKLFEELAIAKRKVDLEIESFKNDIKLHNIDIEENAKLNTTDVEAEIEKPNRSNTKSINSGGLEPSEYIPRKTIDVW